MQQQTKELIVTLTDKNKQRYGLRLGVIAGGCSGYMYDIGLEKSPKENDFVIEDKGVKIFINPQSVAFMKGSTVDYMDSLTNAGFKINNPNVKTSCACGYSVG